MTVRVLIADDDDLMRAGLRSVLASDDTIAVIDEVANGRSAIDRARHGQPDVVLMDIRMPVLDGIAATRELLAGAPASKVLILTTFDDDEYVFGALKAGASGFLLKRSSPEELTAAIHTVAAGDALLSPSITRRVIDRMACQPLIAGSGGAGLDDLTAREREVLELIAVGLSNREIAARLVIEETTVKSHVKRILMKLGLRDRVQAVILAYEPELLLPGREGRLAPPSESNPKTSLRGSRVADVQVLRTLDGVIERLESAVRSARHAVELIVEDVVTVAPGWLVAGVLLHVLQQVVRTRGWFTIIRAAYPEATELRARDVTFAYLAGSGLNSIVPARGGDLAKLYLVRRRAPGARRSTLAATFVPETLFETAVGIGLVIWALSRGFLPVPIAPSEVPSLEVSLFIAHPVLSTVGAVAAGVAGVLLFRALRRRTRGLVAGLRQGFAILERPRDFLRGVVAWQALARMIRLGSIACFMAAFALPVTVATVVLVMAAHGGGRIIPVAPASAGLRIAMLTYGFVAVTGDAVDVARITAFSFGVGVALSATGIAIAIAILGRELGTASPRAIVERVRARLGEANYAGEAG